MSAYPKPQGGQWVIPVLEGYKMACCECGLVHRIDFRVLASGETVDGYEAIDGQRVAMRFFRDNRATGQVRRHMREGRP